MYGKHFESMYTGSMYGAGVEVFAVWGWVISHTVKGRVEINPKMLAPILGTTVEEVKRALDFLESPDPESRSKEHDGRRIIREGQFQYIVPTHSSYNKIANEAERREYLKQKKRDERTRKSGQGMSRNSVNSCQQPSTMSTHTDTDTNTNTKAKEEEKPRTINRSAPFLDDYFRWQNITQEDLERWEKTYPAVDIKAELLKAAEYIRANPTKRKKNYMRYVTNWFSRVQDRGGTKGYQPKQQKITPKKGGGFGEWMESKKQG